MKFSTTVPFLFGLVTAGTIPVDSAAQLQARQTATSDDLKNLPCRDVTFIFARGSTESGNMGTIVGPQTCAALQAQLGASKVACQGVGDGYLATLADNFLPQNTSPEAIQAATNLFQLAHTKCPNTKVVAGGYSQGTAVMDNSIQALSSEIRNQIKGVVLFGFTRNAQDGGKIPNYPSSQTQVYCAVGDLVCDNTLVITPAHLTYGVDAVPAAQFLASKL
ncbi:putative cutinase [Thozetella sp. PMI_491]|nr:putative cutinase [Thozetella sp. PMI_491]